MDSNIIIAVTGITSIVVGAIGTYFLQKRASERQRKWSLEDEEKRKTYERETERRRVKRELLCNRLDMIEESLKIMMNQVSSTVGREWGYQMGIPMYDDRDELKEQGKRLQSIRGEAWAALLALDSKDLMEHWRTIASAYWDVEETGTVGSESWDKAQKTYVEIMKLTDEMRSQV